MAYPTALPTYGSGEFHRGSNLASSPLNTGITGSPGTFVVDDGSRFPANNFVVRIDTELIFVSSRTSNTCTIGARGYGTPATTPADHTSTTVVRVVAANERDEYLQNLSLLLATELGIRSGSVTDGFILKLASGAHEFVKINRAGTSAPTVNEDSGDGYSIGSRWFDTTNDKEYVCLDATLAAAVWRTASSPFITIDAHSVAYSLAESDNGKVHHCTGTFNITLPVSGITTGFNMVVNNVGTGAITFISSGTINARAVNLQAQWGAATVYWSGTAWYLVGDLT